MTAYKTAGMSGASPASIDFVLQNAMGVAGGQLCEQPVEPATPADGAHVYVQNGKVWTKRANGSVNLLNGAQDGMTAPFPVHTTAGVIQVFSYTVPGGEPAAGSMYQVYLWGKYGVKSGDTPNVGFRAYYGGDVLAEVPGIVTAGTETDCLFDLTASLTFHTAGSAFSVIKVGFGTDASTDAAATYVSAKPAVTSSLVTTADKDFGITVKWSASDAANTLTVLGGYGQRIA